MRPTPQPDLVSGAVQSKATPQRKPKEKTRLKESGALGSTPGLSHVILRRGAGVFGGGV